jgi:uncharacterized protein
VAPLNQRFEMRVDEDLLERVDQWRSKQSDIPPRAEAMRRLVELGLGPSSRAVEFSDGEKLIMLMLKDIHAGLKLKGSETDFDFVASVIYGGHYWAPKWVMSGLFHDYADRPEDVTLVVGILDMWSFIEEAYEKLSAGDKKRLADAVPGRGAHVQFMGFDGNNESEHMGIARFLVEELNRFGRFKGRDLNSHAPTLARQRRMLSVFEPMRTRLDGRSLTVGELIELLPAGDARGA